MERCARFAAVFVAGVQSVGDEGPSPADIFPSAQCPTVATAAEAACAKVGARLLGKEIRVLRDEEAERDESFLLPVLTRVRSAMGATRAALLLAAGGVSLCVGFEPPDEDGFAELVLFEPHPRGGGEAATTRFSSMRGLQLHVLSAIAASGSPGRPGSSGDVCLLPIAMPGHLDPKVEAMLVKVRKQAKATAIAQKRRELEALEANLATQLHTASQETRPSAVSGDSRSSGHSAIPSAAAASAEVMVVIATSNDETHGLETARSSSDDGQHSNDEVGVSLRPSQPSRDPLSASGEAIAGEVADLQLRGDALATDVKDGLEGLVDMSKAFATSSGAGLGDSRTSLSREGQSLAELAGLADQMAAALEDAPPTPKRDSVDTSVAVDAPSPAAHEDPLDVAWQMGKQLAVELSNRPTRSTEGSCPSSSHSPERSFGASQERSLALQANTLRQSGQREDGLRLSSQSKPSDAETRLGSEGMRELHSARAAVPSNWDYPQDDETPPPRPEAASTAGSRSPGALSEPAESSHHPSLAQLASADASIPGSALGSALGPPDGSPPKASGDIVHRREAEPLEGADLGMDPASSHDLDLEHLMDDLQAIRTAVARAEQPAVSTDANVKQSATALITAVDGQLAHLASSVGTWQDGRGKNMEQGNGEDDRASADEYRDGLLTATTAASGEFGGPDDYNVHDSDRSEMRLKAPPPRHSVSVSSMNSTAMRSMLASLEGEDLVAFGARAYEGLLSKMLPAASTSVSIPEGEETDSKAAGPSAEIDIDDSIDFRSPDRQGRSSRSRASVGSIQMRDREFERAGGGTFGPTRPESTDSPSDAPTTAQRRAQIAIEHQRAYIEDRRRSERQHHAQEMQAAGRQAFMQLMGRRDMPVPPPAPTIATASRNAPPAQPGSRERQRSRHGRSGPATRSPPPARTQPGALLSNRREPPEPPQLEVSEHDGQAAPGALSPAELHEMFGGQQSSPATHVTVVRAHDQMGGQGGAGESAASPRRSHVVRGQRGVAGSPAARSGRGNMQSQVQAKTEASSHNVDSVLDIKMNESSESPTTRTEVHAARERRRLRFERDREARYGGPVPKPRVVAAAPGAPSAVRHNNPLRAQLRASEPPTPPFAAAHVAVDHQGGARTLEHRRPSAATTTPPTTSLAAAAPPRALSRGRAQARGGVSSVPSGVQTNRQVIRNALSVVCLAGAPDEQRRVEALAALDAAGDRHFVILLVEGITLSYRGVYAHTTRGELQRIVGKCPPRLAEDQAGTLYKYSSTGRKFAALSGRSSFKTTADAISVDPKSLKKILDAHRAQAAERRREATERGSVGKNANDPSSNSRSEWNPRHQRGGGGC